MNIMNISKKCGFCLEKKNKLRMCKYCYCLLCENCLKEWLKKHSSCYKCKTKIKLQDMITFSFDNDFIKNENNTIIFLNCVIEDLEHSKKHDVKKIDELWICYSLFFLT